MSNNPVPSEVADRAIELRRNTPLLRSISETIHREFGVALYDPILRCIFRYTVDVPLPSTVLRRAVDLANEGSPYYDVASIVSRESGYDLNPEALLYAVRHAQAQQGGRVPSGAVVPNGPPAATAPAGGLNRPGHPVLLPQRAYQPPPQVAYQLPPRPAQLNMDASLKNPLPMRDPLERRWKKF